MVAPMQLQQSIFSRLENCAGSAIGISVTLGLPDCSALGTSAASPLGGGWCLVTASALVPSGWRVVQLLHTTPPHPPLPRPKDLGRGETGREGRRGCSHIQPPQFEVRSAPPTRHGFRSRCRNKASSALFLSHTTPHTGLTLATNGHTVLSAGGRPK